VRALKILFVLILLCGLSGVTEFFEQECPPNETSQTHQTCDPTCVRCTCCHQAFEVAQAGPVDDVLLISGPPDLVIRRLPNSSPRDVFHIPKPASL
jgi:hypothetical protein